MKRILYLFAILLCLTGCNGGVNEKELPNQNQKELSNQEKLCNIIMPGIEKYENNQLSYSQFLETFKGDYNSYCVSESNNTCMALSNMYTFSTMDNKLEDCSKYNVNTKIGKAAKDSCESINKLKETNIAKQSENEKSSINVLKVYCQQINN